MEGKILILVLAALCQVHSRPQSWNLFNSFRPMSPLNFLRPQAFNLQSTPFLPFQQWVPEPWNWGWGQQKPAPAIEALEEPFMIEPNGPIENEWSEPEYQWYSNEEDMMHILPYDSFYGSQEEIYPSDFDQHYYPQNDQPEQWGYVEKDEMALAITQKRDQTLENLDAIHEQSRLAYEEMIMFIQAKYNGDEDPEMLNAHMNEIKSAAIECDVTYAEAVENINQITQESLEILETIDYPDESFLDDYSAKIVSCAQEVHDANDVLLSACERAAELSG